MNPSMSSFGAGVFFLASTSASGQLFNIERNPVAQTVIVENSVDPNDATRARIIIEATSTSSPTTINLRATNPSNDIDYVIIRIATPQLVFLQITGANTNQAFDRLGSIDFVPVSGASGDLIVELLRCNGNVGTIRAHGLIEGVVGGSVTGSIEIVDRDPSSTAVRGDLTSLLVGNAGAGTGSILGNVLVSGGNIDALTVGGSIGAPSTPVTITGWSLGIVSNITAGSIHANIQSENPSVGITQVRLLKATSGDFTGGRGTEIGLAISVSGLARPAASHRGRRQSRPRWHGERASMPLCRGRLESGA